MTLLPTFANQLLQTIDHAQRRADHPQAAARPYSYINGQIHDRLQSRSRSAAQFPG